MANEARKEKEAAGRAKLRAGYQELENRKANVRMDVNLREPVKKGRFGASGTSSSRALARGRSRADLTLVGKRSRSLRSGEVC